MWSKACRINLSPRGQELSDVYWRHSERRRHWGINTILCHMNRKSERYLTSFCFTPSCERLVDSIVHGSTALSYHRRYVIR
jgi:hypothetical protein